MSNLLQDWIDTDKSIDQKKERQQHIDIRRAVNE